MNNTDIWDVVVIGSGPGGYAAAFRASDLGKKVLLIDRRWKFPLGFSISPPNDIVFFSRSMISVDFREVYGRYFSLAVV